jgi:AraC family transcriptional regulator
MYRDPDEAIARVVALMRENVARPLSLEEMCKTAHVSPFHFDRLFHRATGLSAGAFQSAIRIEAAKHALLETRRSVTEICFDLGYKSLGSFTTRFSATVGMAPAAFRTWAARLADSDLVCTLARAFGTPQPSGPLHGLVSGAQTHETFVWIGAFVRGIPAHRPASGTLRRGNGAFSIPAPPDGRYDVLCAGIAPSNDWRRYLFCGDHLFVASTGTIAINDGACAHVLDLKLRPMRPTDPPILVPLPLLAL